MGFFWGPKGCRVYGRIRYIDTSCTLQRFLADLLVFKGLFEAFEFGWEGDGRDGRDGWMELGGKGGKRGAPRDVKKKKKKRSHENRGSATAAGHG